MFNIWHYDISKDTVEKYSYNDMTNEYPAPIYRCAHKKENLDILTINNFTEKIYPKTITLEEDEVETYVVEIDDQYVLDIPYIIDKPTDIDFFNYKYNSVAEKRGRYT